MAGRKERTRFVGIVPEFVGFVPDGIPTGDTVELATTEQVPIPAEYGETYTILFTGDEENGFTAQLRP